MNNRSVFYFIFVSQVLAQSLWASADNLTVDFLQIDGEPCQKVPTTTPTSKHDVFHFDVFQFRLFQGATQDDKKSITFKIYNDEADETKEVAVSATFKPQPLSLALTGKPYEPTQKVSDYVKELNQQNLIINQCYEWNNGDETQSIAVWDKDFTPFIQFSCPRRVKFYPWKLDFNKITQKTVVMIPYGPVNEQKPHNQLEIFHIPHKPIQQNLLSTYYVSQYDRPEQVKVIEWSQIPDSHKDWRVLNGREAPATYKSVEHLSPSTDIILNAGDEEKGIYYDFSEEGLAPSRWIYCDGNQNYFLGKVRKVSSRTHLIEEEEKTKLFKCSQKDEVGPTLHWLEKTDIPVLLTGQGTLSSPFQRGFFQLVSDKKTGSNTKSRSQVWQEQGAPENTINFMHATQGAFEKVDLSQQLTQTNVNVQNLVNLLKNYTPARNAATPLTIRVDLTGQETAVRKRVTKNLLDFLTRFENVDVDVKNLSFETTTLTKGSLKYFLRNENFHREKFPDGINPQEIKLTLKEAPLPNDFSRLPKFCPEILDLTGSHLGGAKIESLITHIRGNNRLKSLMLRSIKGVSNDQLKDIAKAVVDQENITSFSYWSPNFAATDASVQSLRPAEKLKLVGKLVNLEGLNLARMDLNDYRDVSRTLERNLLTLKKINFNRAKNMGELGINRLGDELIRKVGRMSKLEELDVLESSMTNGQVVNLAKSLEGLNELTLVKVSMPYHMTGYSELARELKDDWKQVNSLGSFVGQIVKMGACSILSPIILVGDAFGEVYDDYKNTMTSLSTIPNLENLRLCLWGVRRYPEWTKAQIDRARQDAKLSPITITFGN